MYKGVVKKGGTGGNFFPPNYKSFVKNMLYYEAIYGMYMNCRCNQVRDLNNYCRFLSFFHIRTIFKFQCCVLFSLYCTLFALTLHKPF